MNKLGLVKLGFFALVTASLMNISPVQAEPTDSSLELPEFQGCGCQQQQNRYRKPARPNQQRRSSSSSSSS